MSNLRFRYADYVCRDCRQKFDQLLSPKDVPEVAACPNCGGASDKRITAPVLQTIVRGNSDFGERETARLQKRSDDHYKRKGRDEARDREKIVMRKAGLID